MKLENTRYVDNSKSDGNHKAFRAATDLLIMSHQQATTATVSRAFFIVLFDKLSVRARRFKEDELHHYLLGMERGIV
jgi:hypothetical protein